MLIPCIIGVMKSTRRKFYLNVCYLLKEIYEMAHVLHKAFCSDVKWASRHFKSPVIRRFVQEFVRATSSGGIKAPHYWDFVRRNHRWQETSTVILRRASVADIGSMCFGDHEIVTDSLAFGKGMLFQKFESHLLINISSFYYEGGRGRRRGLLRCGVGVWVGRGSSNLIQAESINCYTAILKNSTLINT